MSIQSEIDRLTAAKASIAASLQAMGAEPPAGSTLDQYAAQLAAIAAAAGAAAAVCSRASSWRHSACSCAASAAVLSGRRAGCMLIACSIRYCKAVARGKMSGPGWRLRASEEGGSCPCVSVNSTAPQKYTPPSDAPPSYCSGG